ncbi:Holliday junction resolvase RecU [Cohnella lupini]|uniref:Holliday junction resolvase RecU n=1 Tax=Cohnella lupini TaxID=1294267 RepID=A0A3D9HZ53_9BACL|nr:Holliday junction resolvase RecU [Cohnella lupini]RED54774.1 recombination protein U [Cohnella lupini]
MKAKIPRGNRGMAFESLINMTNTMYENQSIAIINKRPTPVKIMKREANRIYGYLERPSTVDYDGHYRQRGIAFEAKSVAEGDRLDLSNVASHQVTYLGKCHYVGNAIAFLIVAFEAHRKVFMLPYPVLETFWKRQMDGIRGTKSIHILEMEREGFEVRSGKVPLDYLSVVDKVWGL